MSEYLHPGVYVEEIERGPKPIEGVSMSTAAFLCETERGRTMPWLVTSYKDYMQWFGGVLGPDKFMPYAVNGYFENGGRHLFICRIADDAATTAEAPFGSNFIVKAVGPGSWGTRIYAKVENGSTLRAGLNSTAPAKGFRLRLAYYGTTPTQNPLDWFTDAGKPPYPSHAETFDDLDTDESSPDFYEKRLLNASALAMLVRAPNAPRGAAPPNEFKRLSVNGVDGSATLDAADYKGKPIGLRKQSQGLAALELDPYRDVSLLYAPAVSFDIAKEIISHCESDKYRFAVTDWEESAPLDLAPRAAIADTSYAALYFPWIEISDPQTGARKTVPPGGHTLGVYARSDLEHGVFKAPTDASLRGALKVTIDIEARTHDVATTRGINTIRDFPGRGIRVWGARTLSSDALWKYVPMRRLFMFLERSIWEGTQWVVFEPNDERLWARVVETIQLFLRTQWRNGALLGQTEGDAFFIKCDRTTMTQDDILNGRLICEIGVAPLRPAEFVVFRIFQQTTEAKR